jgi:hypothetical protein
LKETTFPEPTDYVPALEKQSKAYNTTKIISTSSLYDQVERADLAIIDERLSELESTTKGLQRATFRNAGAISRLLTRVQSLETKTDQILKHLDESDSTLYFVKAKLETLVTAVMDDESLLQGLLKDCFTKIGYQDQLWALKDSAFRNQGWINQSYPVGASVLMNENNAIPGSYPLLSWQAYK